MPVTVEELDQRLKVLEDEVLPKIEQDKQIKEKGKDGHPQGGPPGQQP